MPIDQLLGAPVIPPKDWLLEIPAWLMAMGVHDIHIETAGDQVGRAAGIYYDADSCFVNRGGCWTVPASPTGGELFHAGHIDYTDGQWAAKTAAVGGLVEGHDYVLVGTIPIAGGHAKANMSLDQALAVHDRPEWQKLVGTIWDVMLPRTPDSGPDDVRQVGLFLGAGVPEITMAEAMRINRSGLSGEWWPRENMVTTAGVLASGLDALGPVLVSKAAIPSNRSGRLQRAQLPVTASYDVTPEGPVLGPSTIYEELPMLTPTLNGQPVAAAVAEVAPGEPVAAGACCSSCAGTPTAVPAAPEVAAPAADPAVTARLDAIEGHLAKMIAAGATPVPVTAALEGPGFQVIRRRVEELITAGFPLVDGERRQWCDVLDLDDSQVIYRVHGDAAWQGNGQAWQQMYTWSGSRLDPAVALEGVPVLQAQDWVPVTS
jgi:hypothetical protein